MEPTISLKEYLDKGKTFVIPSYQRGYIWGKKRPNDETDSVAYILGSILDKFSSGGQIFLQGVTVSEPKSEKDKIVLIDGQQRTTFFYLLLKYLGYSGKFDLEYEVRKASGEFLKNLDSYQETDGEKTEIEPHQDLHFFKKTLGIIKNKIEAKGIDRDELLQFVLFNIRFLYIIIPENQARKVFTMMNGHRAKMLAQEVIKAELLRRVSITGNSDVDMQREWEINLLRSRYAREWHRWIQWWNDREVQTAFNISSQLGWLLLSLTTDANRSSKDKGAAISFEHFCEDLLKTDGSTSIVDNAKEAFDKLRRAQKKFEDTFNDARRHNYVGAILRLSSNPASFIRYYFGDATIDEESLRKYYLCTFIGMTHNEIISKDGFKKHFIEKFDETLKSLKDPLLYENDWERAYRLLLRLNIDQDNLQNEGRGRKFDFTIWESGMRSLEHIYPKSKVYHRDEAGQWLTGAGAPEEPSDNSLLREDISSHWDNFDNQQGVLTPIKESDVTEKTIEPKITEHSIGNLVLLYKDDNSTFNNADFPKKKEIFLVGDDKREFFKSRHLLHTIFHFAEKEWGANEIKKYYYLTLKEFREPYEQIIKSLDNEQN